MRFIIISLPEHLSDQDARGVLAFAHEHLGPLDQTHIQDIRLASTGIDAMAAVQRLCHHQNPPAETLEASARRRGFDRVDDMVDSDTLDAEAEEIRSGGRYTDPGMDRLVSDMKRLEEEHVSHIFPITHCPFCNNEKTGL